MRSAPAFDRRLRRVELELVAADGSAWTLSVSAGMERFIGYYPRLEGLDPGGPLLRYRAVASAF
jgi:hypothetical protein